MVSDQPSPVNSYLRAGAIVGTNPKGKTFPRGDHHDQHQQWDRTRAGVPPAGPDPGQSAPAGNARHRRPHRRMSDPSGSDPPAADHHPDDGPRRHRHRHPLPPAPRPLHPCRHHAARAAATPAAGSQAAATAAAVDRQTGMLRTCVRVEGRASILPLISIRSTHPSSNARSRCAMTPVIVGGGVCHRPASGRRGQPTGCAPPIASGGRGRRHVPAARRRPAADDGLRPSPATPFFFLPAIGRDITHWWSPFRWTGFPRRHRPAAAFTASRCRSRAALPTQVAKRGGAQSPWGSPRSSRGRQPGGKPDGLLPVLRDRELAFLHPLAVRRLRQGVGQCRETRRTASEQIAQVAEARRSRRWRPWSAGRWATTVRISRLIDRHGALTQHQPFRWVRSRR